MILINEIEIFDRKGLDLFIKFFDDTAQTNEQKDYNRVIKDYLENVFEADQKLQRMVSEKISEDLISCVILPYDETDNFDDFKFILINKNKDKVKKREELIYKNFCDLCFESVPGLYSMGLIYYQ